MISLLSAWHSLDLNKPSRVFDSRSSLHLIRQPVVVSHRKQGNEDALTTDPTRDKVGQGFRRVRLPSG